MSAATTSALSIAPSLTPRNSTDNLNPETCVSLVSVLRCYYSDLGQPAELLRTLLIIPVVLELIFSTSLIFTNWRSGRRHLLLVAEGWIIFLLSLVEILSFEVPAVRTQVSAFKATDQSLGALSFIQLFFYMSFLYSWVSNECLSIAPSRIRRIARPLLLLFIPAVIAMNTVASFVGVSYDPPLPGKDHVRVTFRDDRARFVWPFFSSVTLALFTLFQASCFCFAFYRLMRALWIQRKFEADSKDAAVLFRGIGWINAGIKLGAIETVVGFVFYGGIPIAYVRRILRMLSRAFLSIGVAKGMDAAEDFQAFQDELESRSSEKNFRRSKFRNFISNPRFSTFQQLSPTAIAFHAAPRAPGFNHDLVKSSSGKRPHPYAAISLLTTEGKSQNRDSLYARSPLYDTESLVSPKSTTNNGLPGMSQFAEIKAKRMSQRTQKRVTVYYQKGTPTLHLRFSTLDLPSPAVIAENVARQSRSEIIEGYRNSLARTHESRPRRSSATSPRSSVPSVYPASPTHANAVESYNLYQRESNAYGNITSSPSSKPAETPSARNRPTSAFAAHSHSPATSTSYKFEPPTPGYLDSPTWRLSDFSQASGISADQAEIVDTPRRQLSVSRQRSTLARAVLYPIPSTKVAMALSNRTDSPSPSTPSKRSVIQEHATPLSSRMGDLSLPSIQRLSHPSAAIPSPSPLTTSQLSQQQQRGSFVRDSVIEGDGNVVSVTAIAPSTDEDDSDSDEKPRRNTRAISGYSVGSVPETLQAVRELAKKFPGLPPGALVADIGFRASTMTPPRERDEMSSISGHSNSHGESAAVSAGPGQSSTESTDTEEMVKKRIPAELKMKSKMTSEGPPLPLPPLPSQQIQQLPAKLPQRSPKRPQPPRPLRSQFSHPSLKNATSHITHPQSQFAPVSIDPFDDGESYWGSATELSPLSMSIKLRHPRSFASTMYSSIRPQSGMTTGPTSGVTSPVSPSYYSKQDQSQEGAISPDIIDFGSALKEWNKAGQTIPGIRPMRDLPSMQMIEGHRRSLSAQTRAEFDRLQQRRQRPESIVSDDLDVSDSRQLEKQRTTISSATGASVVRIKSIGKVPRRITPQPTRGRTVRGSTHLQPLVIPASPPFGKDVPVSAVDAGGLQTILGVNRAGMNVDVAKEQGDTATEGTTSSSSGQGVQRYSEALSIENGGYAPIKLQGSRKGSY